MGIQKEITASRGVIIAGGSLEDYAFLKQNIRPTDYIICADSGLRHAINAGITPHCVVGDFDSYTAPLPLDCEILRLPVQKDETDLLAAANLAVQKGFRHLCFFAALGSRPDQSFAALQNLAQLEHAGVFVEVLGPTYKAFVLREGSVSIPKQTKTYLSIFPFGGDACGVTLRGVEYPLEDQTLRAYASVGVSNRITADFATVLVKKGTLLIWLVQED